VLTLLHDIRHNPLLWLLVFVPAALAGEQLAPDAHRLLFALSVLAIVPLAALLSHATESVAAKTGDAVGGLLNATLGNLTELVIALAALGAGQYMLVKASIAGAIVTNTLFMMGASFLLGGLKHRVQEFNRVSARLQAGLLFLATVALLIPSAVAQADSGARAAITQTLSLGLAILLIATYALSMLFSLKTHREFFASKQSGEAGEVPWPLGLALPALAGVTLLVALVSEIFVASVQEAATAFGMTPPSSDSSSSPWWAERRRWPRHFPARVRTGSTSVWGLPWAAHLRSRSSSPRCWFCSATSSARCRWTCSSGRERW
jgi:Ca2+:H+ antiporter